MQRRVLRRTEGTQISYTLPHRIHATQVYPRTSSNGSSIIIYAHEQGLRIVWLGGSGSGTTTQQSAASNGESVDLIEVSSDTRRGHEIHEEEVEGYDIPQDILTYHDVDVGVACTKLAIPPIGKSYAADESHAIINSHIVLAAACADSSLRLIALPLDPTEESTSDCQLVSIGGANSHTDLISDIAITFTSELADIHDASHLNSLQPRGSIQEVAPLQSKLSILLASTSPTGTGLLLTHLIPINDSSILSMDPQDHVPVQRQHVRAPLARCSLSFNPVSYVDERHSHLLVSIYDASAVKIYQMLPQLNSSRRRRGSATTTDSAASATKSSRLLSSVSGRPLITLLSPFKQQGGPDHSSQRKRILDAKWVLNGQAILVLQEDGEWGVWDLESTGLAQPSISGKNAVASRERAAGLQGGSVAKYAVRGNVNQTIQTSQDASIKTKGVQEKSLAPMTPHTRKVRTAGFFNKVDANKPSLQDATQILHGSISTSVQDWTATGQVKSQEEAILLSYGLSDTLIPSLTSLLKAGGNTRGASEGLAINRLTTLPSVGTAVAIQRSVHLLPSTSPPGTQPVLAGKASIPRFLVTHSSQMFIFVPPTDNHIKNQQTSSILPLRLTYDKSASTEQSLLASGELNIDGVDRMLDLMARGSTDQASTTSTLGGNRVGFHFDDGEDMDMDSPTVKKSSKSNLVVTNSNGSGRRLFT